MSTLNQSRNGPATVQLREAHPGPAHARAGVSEPARESPNRIGPRRPLVVVAVAVVVGLVAFAVWRLFLAPPAVAPGVIAVSGRIEGDDSAVAAKGSGRIREITVREGDRVEAGQVIAGLDEQLRQRRLGVDQARGDAEGRANEAEGRLAAAEAQLAQAQAAHAQAKWDREAMERLFQKGLIAEQEALRARNNEEAQAAIVAAQRRQVDAARGALTAAKANLVNPAIRSSQVVAVQGQILQAQADIAAAQAEAERARAQLEEARANRRDLRVVAPFNGTVATRTAEPGEVVMAGTAVITLVNLAEVYLRAFVPEGQIGRVSVGQPARVYLDSAAAKPIDAYVLRVDPQASFTPENTYFREDRVKQVVGVKLRLKSAVGFAKPGMPADGEILVDGGDWPTRQARR